MERMDNGSRQDLARVEGDSNDLDCRMRKLEMKGHDVGENKHPADILKRTDKLEDKDNKENGAKWQPRHITLGNWPANSSRETVERAGGERVDHRGRRERRAVRRTSLLSERRWNHREGAERGGPRRRAQLGDEC